MLVMRIRRIQCKKYMKRLKCYELISYFCNCKISPCSGNNVCMCKFSRIIPIILVSVLTLCGGGYNCLSAKEVKDSVTIYFRQGYSLLVMSIRENLEALARIADSLEAGYADSVYVLQKISVIGGASPEGSIPLNKRLSEKRANVLFKYLSRYGELPDSLTTFTFIGRDWWGLVKLVENDPAVPYREETLEYLRDIASRSVGGEKVEDNNVGRLSRFKGGAPYRYMYQNLFPELRASSLHLYYKKIWNPIKLPPVAAVPVPLPAAPEIRLSPLPIVPYVPKKPFYMGVKTNLLYDALLVPNVGVEFYLGKNWSIAGDWMYAWWNKDRIHWYWRTYGGGLTLRKWFGRKAQEKPLTGHHVGIYGQALTYDFETGGRGYLGGKPGGDIFDLASINAGIEYGYSLPVAERLNLDFTAGIGYLGGKYYEYIPMDQCYVWQVTKKRRYIGPTRLEVSLVWLIGRGNYNKDKGGRR